MSTDIDVLNLYPLQDGKVPASSAVMRRMKHVPEERQKIFLFDEHYNVFRENKVQCRLERPDKYYQREFVDIRRACNFIIGTLLEEYPGWFLFIDQRGDSLLKNKATSDWVIFDQNFCVQDYEWGDIRIQDHPPVDLLDFLAMQVPCDLVLFSKEGAEALHLCSPSGWSAEWALGRSFAEIHDEVITRAGKHVVRSPEKMVSGILRMAGATERVGAISFRSTWELNRHPENKPPDVWDWGEDQQVFLRFERQMVMPLGDYFLFTIRSYYNDLLHPTRINQAIEALENIHENNYARDYLDEHAENLRAFLEGKRRLLM